MLPGKDADRMTVHSVSMEPPIRSTRFVVIELTSAMGHFHTKARFEFVGADGEKLPGQQEHEVIVVPGRNTVRVRVLDAHAGVEKRPFVSFMFPVVYY